MSAQDPNSTMGIIGNVLNAMNGLVRNEVDLARAEISESVKTVAIAVGLIAVAMVVSFVALNVLTGALVSAVVAAGLTLGWASLAVGAVYFLIAATLVSVGMNKLKSFSLAPKRTARNLRKDAATIVEAAR